MLIAFIHLFSTVPPTAETFTLSLHDALPISAGHGAVADHGHHLGVGVRAAMAHALLDADRIADRSRGVPRPHDVDRLCRSEEHTSELQSRFDLVCRLLLEKKKKFCNFNSVLL